MADRVRGGAKSGFMAAAAALVLGLALLAPAQDARAANLLEKNFWLSGPNYSGNVPACDYYEALNIIAMRFSETEKTYWNSSLAITGFTHLSQVAFRPWGDAYVPRRYCKGTVFMSDARKRSIYYSIVEDGGFIGAGWGVEWCIEGLDRSFAYAPNCKMAGP